MATVRGLLSSILPGGGTTEEDEEDESLKPEGRVKRFPIRRATVHYTNGQEDEFEFYHVKDEKAGYRFLQGFKPSPLPCDIRTTDGRFVPYETLSRPPISERVGTATVYYTYDPAADDPLGGGGVNITNVEEDYGGDK